MAETMTFGEWSLNQQGYDYSPEDLRKLYWGLRFTPLLCMYGAIYGLYTQQPYIHFALAALGILPFWFPSAHPLDVFYNAVVRHVVRGVKLPPNPLPRRIACLMGGSMNFGIGYGFISGNVMPAYVFGAILIPLQIIVISTHFCVASWMYEGLIKLIGQWDRPISSDEAHRLVNEGAKLVDVRGPDEFAGGHLSDAINVPLDDIEQHLDVFREQKTVLYCQSGMRCQSAAQALKRNGIEETFILGAMKRWGEEQS